MDDNLFLKRLHKIFPSYAGPWCPDTWSWRSPSSRPSLPSTSTRLLLTSASRMLSGSWLDKTLNTEFLNYNEPKNRFQGINYASLCSLAGRYENLIPTRFLAPIDCLKISALAWIKVIMINVFRTLDKKPATHWMQLIFWQKIIINNKKFWTS